MILAVVAVLAATPYAVWFRLTETRNHTRLSAHDQDQDGPLRPGRSARNSLTCGAVGDTP
jgi:hypothetical protein